MILSQAQNEIKAREVFARLTNSRFKGSVGSRRDDGELIENNFPERMSEHPSCDAFVVKRSSGPSRCRIRARTTRKVFSRVMRRSANTAPTIGID
jgi:hypothetical protein